MDDARQYHLETIFVDSPVFVLLNECSNESEVGSVFTSNIIMNLEKFIMKTTQGEGLKFHLQSSIFAAGRPDYSVIKNSNTMLFIELKTKWEVDSVDTIQDYLNQDSRLSIGNAIRQVFGYLGDGKLRYGVLSTYDRNWFLYRPPEDPGCLKFSDCIERGSSNPTLFKCLAFILYLAVQGHECPPPPPPSSDSDPLSVESSELDGEAKHPSYQPSEGSSGRRNTGTGKLGLLIKEENSDLSSLAGILSWRSISLGKGVAEQYMRLCSEGKGSH